MLDIFDDFGGIAGNDGIRRYIFRDYRISSDDTAVAEMHARQYRGSNAYPYIIFNNDFPAVCGGAVLRVRRLAADIG